MKDHPSAATAPLGAAQPVIVVGAGPVGMAAALLLADAGIPVTLLERHLQPHPLPRAVHLDDEVARILHRAGVSEGFLARSRPCSGLRLLDARHRVMAEFGREQTGVHGYPQANMFHQPDLEELLLARVTQHPLISSHRGAEIFELNAAPGPLTAAPVEVAARLTPDNAVRTFTGCLVLGCDGAGSTIRDLAGITMEDLGFTERWLVIDIRVEAGLDTWDGVEQVCDPARAATFMQVTGDRYRWEFQLRDGEDETSLITPQALGGLLRPWTGRSDLGGPGDHPQRQLHLPCPAGHTLPDRACVPARRRRPPHPAVHRPGPGSRAARRRQPRLEDRPCAHRPGRGRTCWPRTTPSAGRTPAP